MTLCYVCLAAVDDDEAHFPHDLCFAKDGEVCECHYPTHPGCCWECKTEEETDGSE